MKPIWLAGTALLALAALIPAAQAQRVNFTYTCKLVTYTVPTTALYQITAYGAQGGSFSLGGITGTGGLGAEIGGDFSLTGGEVLQIAVGGAGANDGGGGGSFVVGPNTQLLLAAGGGGGGGVVGHGPPYSALDGGDGLTSQNGGNGSGTNGGASGNGGGTYPQNPGAGGGGAGFYSAGASSEGASLASGGLGGLPFSGDLVGGSIGGGFGGGGGAAEVGFGGGGGGGGYSGGGGGQRGEGGHSQGGGGGSFDAGIDQLLVVGIQTGDGEVIIKTIFVGTPGSRAAMARLSLTWPSNTAASMPQPPCSAIPACRFCRTRLRSIAQRKP